MPTPRQKDCLATIITLLDLHGYPPTVREVARAMNLSITRVSHMIDMLVVEEYLERRERIARGLVVSSRAREIVSAYI
jgi:repressor LexA